MDESEPGRHEACRLDFRFVKDAFFSPIYAIRLAVVPLPFRHSGGVYIPVPLTPSSLSRLSIPMLCTPVMAWPGFVLYGIPTFGLYAMILFYKGLPMNASGMQGS